METLVIISPSLVPFIFVGVVLVVAFVSKDVKVKAFKYLRIKH